MSPENKKLHMSLADGVTLFNSIMGFTALMILTYGDQRVFSGVDNVILASVLVFVGVILDSVDGPLAKKFGASAIGATLDVISDAITFCVVPAIILFITYKGVGPLVLLPCNLIVIFGLIRLVRFYNTPEIDSEQFLGLPTPIAATIIVGFALLNASAYLALSIATLTAYLMISGVSYPKARAERSLMTLIGVILITLLIVVYLFFSAFMQTYLMLILTFIMASVVILPFFAARSKKKTKTYRT